MCPPKCVVIAERGEYHYDMAIRTGVWKNSGTTAKVTISIKGELNEHNCITLRSEGEPTEIFARGSINAFVLTTHGSLGPITSITLEHDNSGQNPSWFVETVTIRDRQTEEQWTFSFNRWLALEKDDGEIHVTVTDESVTLFLNHVRTQFARRVVDNHLWMSVFGKPCTNTFTRVQRASCCLSILFSVMITNAMFYNIGGESEDTIRVGPFKFSFKQIIIGVQSGLIVAPVNILVVFIFKSSKSKSKTSDTYDDTYQAQQLADQVAEAGYMLPHFCVYLAWFLCLATTLTGATFSLFYSLMWEKEVAEQWLSSILISNGQDIFVVQPAKVLFMVVVLSFFLTKSFHKSQAKDEESNEGSVSEIDIDFSYDSPQEFIKQTKLDAMRRRTKKEVKLAGMVKDIILHLTFVFFLLIVCYDNNSSYRYVMTKTLMNPFTKFDKVIQSYDTSFFSSQH